VDLQVEGEWNGKMVGKWSSGRTDTFLDVTKLPVTKKIVRKVAEQEKHESRYSWQYCGSGIQDPVLF
jgi:oxysterol-binding protein-related protein 9/10/11